MNQRQRAAALLRTDRLRHIVTLKMLHVHGAAVDVRLVEDGAGWAAMSVLPARASEYDSATYPDARAIVFVDGSSDAGKRGLLEELPAGPLVVKTYDDLVRRHVVERRSAREAQSFISFTASRALGERVSRRVDESSVLDDEAAVMFAANGYERAELDRYFDDGAAWLGTRDGPRLIAACLIFRNHETVWEIGGVFTDPEHRRQGHAKNLVEVARDRLLSSGRIPRYQVRSDNAPSIRLAGSAGLEQFLRIDHYVID